VGDPPLLVPVEEIYSEADANTLTEAIHESLRSYRQTLQGDRRRLLETYRFLQLAQRSSASAASAPVPGSLCFSAGMTRTPFRAGQRAHRLLPGKQ
jgi:hypothetical protein